MITTDTSVDALLADIRRCWSASQTPSDLREKFEAWSRENKEHIDRLRAVMGASAAWWIIKGREAGHDADILDQVALQATQWVIATIARTMKKRQGEAFEPARIAIVAYEIAQRVGQNGGEVDLEGLTQTAEAITNDVEADNERLRELISDIADMDLGDPEMEHREIIARCREETMRWEGKP